MTYDIALTQNHGSEFLGVLTIANVVGIDEVIYRAGHE
jgi:hypothetical protein